MNAPDKPPLSSEQLIQLGFIQARSRLVDVAAFLDRVQRADSGSGGSRSALEDERVAAILAAMRLALDGQPERARRILESFSDLSTDPVAHADGKAARGIPNKP